MHTSAFDIPKSQTQLRGVEHTQKRQMFVPICKAKYKLKLLAEGIQLIRMDCVLVLQEKSKKSVRLITTTLKCWALVLQEKSKKPMRLITMAIKCRFSVCYSTNVNETLK